MSTALKVINTILAVCLITACGVVLSFAEDEPELSIYNTRIITNDVDTTYIEGEVPVACGQRVIVSNGFTAIATKALPDTNAKAGFRIKIPANRISKSRVTVLYVRTDGGEGQNQLLGKRVEINYKEKKSQKISVENEEFSLTYPGLNETLVAKATSGDELVYVSSDPAVAKVDENGTITPVGEGEAKISIRQIGTGEYKKAEKSVKVAVEAINAYTVTFHSSADEDETSTQIIPTDTTEQLQANEFENGSHQFLGWATEDDGLVKYTDAESVADIAEKGENTDLYAVWTGDGARAAVAWAINIANDNSFTYGTGPACHRIGCFFCGTNQRNKPKGYEKTYVCLTFIGAAYAHGAEDSEILAADRSNKMPMYENNDNFSHFSCWNKIGSCANLTINDLQPGDVIIKWAANNDTGHVCMYIGGDNLVEAANEGWGANTISVNAGAARRLQSLRFDSRNYVMRYKY